MLHRKFILFSILSIVYGQSIHNAYGLGLISFSHNAAASAMSSRGIVPSFNQNISLSNPVTWNNLKFAYLSGNYKGDKFTRDSNENGLTGISSAQFAVSIGENYAWGFGLKPLFNQQYLINDNQTEFYVDDDTLLTQRSVDGSGGVSALYTAFQFPVTDNENMALEFDILFGSLRKDSKFSIDQRSYHQFHRQIYTGTLYKIFMSSDRFENKNLPLNLYFMFGGSINPLKIKHHSFQPFEDVNLNGFYDSADSPTPSSVPIADLNIYNNAFNPTELGFGLDMRMKNNVHLMFEVHSWKDKGVKPGAVFPLISYYVNQSDQFSLGFAKFSPAVAFQLSQKFQYRGSVYFRKDVIDASNLVIDEMGIAIGIGVKFGFTNNQIDFAYKYGIRTSEIIPKEKIQHFTIGLQLGDLWFVKRRPN